jgi:hypothetical protein
MKFKQIINSKDRKDVATMYDILLHYLENKFFHGELTYFLVINKDELVIDMPEYDRFDKKMRDTIKKSIESKFNIKVRFQ